MSVTWDYTDRAAAYADRPAYSPEVLDSIVAITKPDSARPVCDIGAGTGHLTAALVNRGLRVDAVEPNDEMRRHGMRRLAPGGPVAWHVGTGERSGLGTGNYDLVTFGSSFNVTNRPLALAETARLLRPGGWFACLWNHRDLTDPLQHRIEARIREMLPTYEHGSRRDSQVPVVEASGLFGPPIELSAHTLATVRRDAWARGWKSHATLERQAGDRFGTIVAEIAAMLADLPEEITVPYVTRGLVAQRVTTQ